jgi:hypothetical protein
VRAHHVGKTEIAEWQRSQSGAAHREGSCCVSNVPGLRSVRPLCGVKVKNPTLPNSREGWGTRAKYEGRCSKYEVRSTNYELRIKMFEVG